MRAQPALDGVRILELSTMITGPLAGMMLADLGADVIKIEGPNGGDPFRSFRGGAYSPHFCAYNRNKRSVQLDLKTTEGRESLAALIETADVILDNYRTGVMERLDLTDEHIVNLNPRIIRCSITGFGRDGPYAKRPAYDAIAQAHSGLSSLFIDIADPRITGPTIADNVTGHYACQGILAALLERERSGNATRIEVNMLEAALAFIPDPFAYYTQLGMISDPNLRAHTSQSYVFKTQDRKLFAVHLSSQTKFWEAFVAAIECPELLSDHRFATRLDRIKNYIQLSETLRATFLDKPLVHWVEKFTRQGVPSAPVYDVTEVFADPQVVFLDSFSELNHPEMGALTVIRRPLYRNGSRDDQPLWPPPKLGEHTDEVLRELAELPHRQVPA